VYTFLVGKKGEALMRQEVRTQLGGEEDVVSIHLHLNTSSCNQQQLQQQQQQWLKDDTLPPRTTAVATTTRLKGTQD
jgi:hypothetical protein